MIREIHPHRLFIGNASDARNLQLLYERRIAAVVDLAANELPAQLARDMVYCRFPLVDGKGNSLALIQAAIRTVVMLVESDVRTLVACSAGMSRAPAIAAAASAIRQHNPPDECLAALAQFDSIDVSPAFWTNVRDACSYILRISP
jgi:protein-tyrosine phosphatase